MNASAATSGDYIGVLLAAGTGSRYLAATATNARDHAGHATPPHKLLATLPDGQAVAASAARTLRTALPHTLAVITAQPPDLERQLAGAGCEILLIPPKPSGMGVSLAAAARHLLSRQHTRPPAGCVVALADMPWLQADTVSQLLAHAAHDRIVVPVYHGQRGHPVVFGAQFFSELATMNGDTGAKSLLARHGVVAIECDDPGILRDIDVPADLYPSIDE